jgi:hypothetical protein
MPLPGAVGYAGDDQRRNAIEHNMAAADRYSTCNQEIRRFTCVIKRRAAEVGVQYPALRWTRFPSCGRWPSKAPGTEHQPERRENPESFKAMHQILRIRLEISIKNLFSHQRPHGRGA